MYRLQISSEAMVAYIILLVFIPFSKPVHNRTSKLVFTATYRENGRTDGRLPMTWFHSWPEET